MPTLSEYLSFYFRQVYLVSGLRWEGDNQGEVEDMVHEIEKLIDVRTNGLNKRVEEMAAQIEALQKAGS